MASAFERPTTTTTVDRTELAAKISSNMSDQTKSTESETEDEEVKRNCIRGFREIEESDFNTTDDSDDDSDDDDDNNESDAHEGVVKFIGSGVEPLQRDSDIIKPKATTPIKGRLSTHVEDEEEEDNMSSSNVSTGIRGVNYSFEGSSDSSSEESEDDNGEEERDDREDEGDEEDNDETEDEETTSSVGEEHIENDSDEEESQAESDGNQVDMSRKMSFEVSDDGIVFDIEEDGNDEEPSTIFKAASDEESYAENIERYLGVTEDRNDPVSIPKTKRVLSHVALLSLQKEDSQSPESPKRMKISPDQVSEGPPSMLLFDLGPAALTFEFTPAGSMLRARPSSPVLTSSDDDDEAWDRQLGEELHSGDEHDEEQCAVAERDNTPIPLLTPPQSPLTVEVDGVASTVCEWPSNLAVDSAMAAASELRPMSPDSLQELERAEERRLHDASSTLTPLIRGISFLA